MARVLTRPPAPPAASAAGPACAFAVARWCNAAGFASSTEFNAASPNSACFSEVQRLLTPEAPTVQRAASSSIRICRRTVGGKLTAASPQPVPEHECGFSQSSPSAASRGGTHSRPASRQRAGVAGGDGRKNASTRQAVKQVYAPPGRTPASPRECLRPSRPLPTSLQHDDSASCSAQQTSSTTVSCALAAELRTSAERNGRIAKKESLHLEADSDADIFGRQSSEGSARSDKSKLPGQEAACLHQEFQEVRREAEHVSRTGMVEEIQRLRTDHSKALSEINELKVQATAQAEDRSANMKVLEAARVEVQAAHLAAQSDITKAWAETRCISSEVTRAIAEAQKQAQVAVKARGEMVEMQEVHARTIASVRESVRLAMHQEFHAEISAAHARAASSAYKHTDSGCCLKRAHVVSDIQPANDQAFQFLCSEREQLCAAALLDIPAACDQELRSLRVENETLRAQLEDAHRLLAIAMHREKQGAPAFRFPVSGNDPLLESALQNRLKQKVRTPLNSTDSAEASIKLVRELDEISARLESVQGMQSHVWDRRSTRGADAATDNAATEPASATEVEANKYQVRKASHQSYPEYPQKSRKTAEMTPCDAQILLQFEKHAKDATAHVLEPYGHVQQSKKEEVWQPWPHVPLSDSLAEFRASLDVPCHDMGSQSESESLPMLNWIGKHHHPRRASSQAHHELPEVSVLAHGAAKPVDTQRLQVDVQTSNLVHSIEQEHQVSQQFPDGPSETAIRVQSPRETRHALRAHAAVRLQRQFRQTSVLRGVQHLRHAVAACIGCGAEGTPSLQSQSTKTREAKQVHKMPKVATKRSSMRTPALHASLLNVGEAQRLACGSTIDLERQHAAIMVQSLQRGRVARRKAGEMVLRERAFASQSPAMGHGDGSEGDCVRRVACHRRRSAAIKLQCFMRKRIAQRDLSQTAVRDSARLLQRCHTAAVKIQSVFRGNVVRRKVASLLDLRKIAYC